MNNKAFFLIAIAFLASLKSQLSAQLLSDINSGKIGLINETLYLRKEITGGGIINLLDTNSRNVPGICNFDTNVLQAGRVVVFDQISIGYKSNAAAGMEGQLTYNSAAPVELQNAIFQISQNGRILLSKPFLDVHNIGTGININDAYTELKALCLLVDDRPITMQLVFPPGVALAGGTHHYIDIRLNGVQTVVKV